MDIKYKFQCTIGLSPGRDTPVDQVKISLDQDLWYDGPILEPIELSVMEFLSPGIHRLTVDFLHKSDPIVNPSLKIHSLSINSVTDPRFIWAGIYCPEYPRLWYDQQVEKGIILGTELTDTDYLEWPGTWRLDFTSPVFTWIHQMQGLGWIYD